MAVIDALVRTLAQRDGVGTMLLMHLLHEADRPVLTGTWRAATWAIDFYCKHGIECFAEDQVPALRRCYRSIPDRQIETSMVLRHVT